jgi:hypothetical protein
LAANLGKTVLTKADVQQVLSHSSVRYHFGTLRKAVEAAGLKISSPTEHLKDIRRVLSDDELFNSINRVEQQLGHEPSACEYRAGGEYSPQPFKHRFGGKWSDALAHYRKWKADRGVTPVPAATNYVATTDVSQDKRYMPAQVTLGSFQIPDTAPVQLYGEPFDFRGLRHAPINEQGVVYLFGMVSRELGFYVESIQQGFPDCEAKYLYDAKKNLWARARIEFEFKASSFKEHGHDPCKCDVIICWMNDWPECPLRVIELKKEILKLSSR